LIELFEGKKRYIALFAGIFLLEAILACYTGHPYDTDVWFKTGLWLNKGINIYLPDNHLGYPPLWALWCGFAYKIYSLAANNFELWRLILKLPLIVAHLALAYVLATFAARHFNIKTGQKVLLITLIWSFFIYIGALWGQINMISVLLTFIAFYAVVVGKTKTSAVALAMAVALKIYPIVALPAFFIYVLKKSGVKQASLYALLTCAIPVVFTLLIFAVFQWDILYFLKTIFYWAPVYDKDPVQITGGCMNFFSFLSLLGINISKFWILRFIWIPILAAASLYWLKKPKMDDGDLNFSIIMLYLLFMVSYVWVSEQAFIDPLPFIMLQVLAYRPKKLHLYALSAVQMIIYVFSFFNNGISVFEPLIQKFLPVLTVYGTTLDPGKSQVVWNIRGFLGLIVALTLIWFLIILFNAAKDKTPKNPSSGP
jgi:Gpi18-like mannosyltransferase